MKEEHLKCYYDQNFGCPFLFSFRKYKYKYLPRQISSQNSNRKTTYFKSTYYSIQKMAENHIKIWIWQIFRCC